MTKQNSHPEIFCHSLFMHIVDYVVIVRLITLYGCFEMLKGSIFLIVHISMVTIKNFMGLFTYRSELIPRIRLYLHSV